MKKIDCCLIVFAKAPIPGKVKTRLIPSIGANAAASLHEELAFHSLLKAIHSDVGLVELWCSPSTNHPFFNHCTEKFHLRLYEQTEGDLGRRMAYAFGQTFKRVSSAILIGTDCPSLTQDDLKEAAEILKNGTDAVIGPAEDGGYVLIGLCHFAPELFTGISWGTDLVLEQTRARLQSLGWRWHELKERWDVDRPEDLERLRREGLLKGLEEI